MSENMPQQWAVIEDDLVIAIVGNPLQEVYRQWPRHRIADFCGLMNKIFSPPQPEPEGFIADLPIGRPWYMLPSTPMRGRWSPHGDPVFDRIQCFTVECNIEVDHRWISVTVRIDDTTTKIALGPHSILQDDRYFGKIPVNNEKEIIITTSGGMIKFTLIQTWLWDTFERITVAAGFSDLVSLRIASQSDTLLHSNLRVTDGGTGPHQ